MPQRPKKPVKKPKKRALSAPAKSTRAAKAPLIAAKRSAVAKSSAKALGKAKSRPTPPRPPSVPRLRPPKRALPEAAQSQRETQAAQARGQNLGPCTR